MADYFTWKQTESNDRPLDIDKTSSHTTVYIAKNVKFIEATEDKDAHYEYQVMKIPHNEWGLFESVMSHDTALDDVYSALTELAEIIVGGTD